LSANCWLGKMLREKRWARRVRGNKANSHRPDSTQVASRKGVMIDSRAARNKANSRERAGDRRLEPLADVQNEANSGVGDRGVG
jgi:hypothetical protein